MELDATRITIRERGYLDILDLALRVVRGELLPILAAGLVGVVPFVLLNHWLVNSEVVADLLDPEIEVEDRIGNWLGYLYVLTLLILLEIPLATAPLTLYLGQITFTKEFDARRAAGEFARSLPQLLLLQVVIRALLLPWVITWFFLFVLWPYLNEVILLERSPLFRRRGSALATTVSRITGLHSPNTGDLMARAFATITLVPVLVFALWSSMWMIHGLLAESWSLRPVAVTVYLPIAIWTTVVLFTVVRFLAYLDLRIRNEGWELELRMRAEGMRLAPPATI